MPQAVTHFIIPALLAALFRDWYNKRNKTRVPLHYVFIAGLAGLLPDLDIAAFAILQFFGFSILQVHRTLTHSIFFPMLFIALALIFHSTNIKKLGKHKLHLPSIFWIISFGTATHIILDATLSGYLALFSPFNNSLYGLNLLGDLPSPFKGLAVPTLDGIILIFWLVYLEVKHKLSNFI